MRSLLKRSYFALILLAIYIPLFVFVVFAFNSNDSMSVFGHFSGQWFQALSQKTGLIGALFTSLLVAMIASACATVFGTLAAVGLSKCRKITQRSILKVNFLPLINADIITAVALMIFFLFCSFKFGFFTLVLAHISFTVPYVVITVFPLMRKVSQTNMQAAYDLGANNRQVFWKVILPVIKPGIIAGAALAFAASFDDFIISYFTSGATNNIAVYIYAVKRLEPFINAFGALLLLVIVILVILWNLFLSYKNYKTIISSSEKIKAHMQQKILFCEKHLIKSFYYLNYPLVFQTKWQRLNQILYKRHQAFIIKQIKRYEKQIILWAKWANRMQTNLQNRQAQTVWLSTKTKPSLAHQNPWYQFTKIKHFGYMHKRWLAPLSLACLLVGAIFLVAFLYVGYNSYDLVFANWGEYINPAIITGFEKKYHKKVNYILYSSNEELYNKTLTTHYDVMVPSDYMVQIMAQQNDLAVINYHLLNQANPNYHIYKPAYIASQSANNQYAIDSTFSENNYPAYYQLLLQAQQNPQSVASRPFFNYAKVASFNPAAIKTMQQYSWKDSDDSKKGILNYALPYMWGGVRLIANMNNPKVATFLQTHNVNVNISDQQTVSFPGSSKLPARYATTVADPKTVSWNLIAQAAQSSEDLPIILSDDYRNIFMIASEYLYGTVSPKDPQQAQAEFNWLKTWIDRPNVKLLNSDIVNATGDGDFGLAVMYNGDATYADIINHQLNQAQNQKENLMVIPRAQAVNNQPQGTNVWTDNLVLAKSDANNPVAYALLNYIIQHTASNSMATSNATPMLQGLNYLTGQTPVTQGAESMQLLSNNAYYFYRAAYIPLAQVNSQGQYHSVVEPGDQVFQKTALAKVLLNYYNRLIAGKN